MSEPLMVSETWMVTTDPKRWPEGSARTFPSRDAALAGVREALCLSEGDYFWIGRRVKPLDEWRAPVDDVLESLWGEAANVATLASAEEAAKWQEAITRAAADALRRELERVTHEWLRAHRIEPTFAAVADVAGPYEIWPLVPTPIQGRGQV